MNTYAFVNYEGSWLYYDVKHSIDPECGMIQGDSHIRKGKTMKAIKSILKQQPEAILYFYQLAGLDDDNGLMYIKGEIIYVYEIFEEQSYELNDFLRKRYRLNTIRSFNVDSRLPYYHSHSYKPMQRKTGRLSPFEINLCP